MGSACGKCAKDPTACIAALSAPIREEEEKKIVEPTLGVPVREDLVRKVTEMKPGQTVEVDGCIFTMMEGGAFFVQNDDVAKLVVGDDGVKSSAGKPITVREVARTALLSRTKTEAGDFNESSKPFLEGMCGGEWLPHNIVDGKRSSVSTGQLEAFTIEPATGELVPLITSSAHGLFGMDTKTVCFAPGVTSAAEYKSRGYPDGEDKYSILHTVYHAEYVINNQGRGESVEQTRHLDVAVSVLGKDKNGRSIFDNHPELLPPSFQAVTAKPGAYISCDGYAGGVEGRYGAVIVDNGGKMCQESNLSRKTQVSADGKAKAESYAGLSGAKHGLQYVSGSGDSATLVDSSQTACYHGGMLSSGNSYPAPAVYVTPLLENIGCCLQGVSRDSRLVEVMQSLQIPVSLAEVLSLSHFTYDSMVIDGMLPNPDELQRLCVPLGKIRPLLRKLALLRQLHLAKQKGTVVSTGLLGRVRFRKQLGSLSVGISRSKLDCVPSPQLALEILTDEKCLGPAGIHASFRSAS